MSRKFKGKKRFNPVKLFIYIILIIFIYFCYRWISSLSIVSVDNKLLNYMINDYNNYSYNNKQKETLISTIIDYPKEKLNKPSSILLSDLVYEEKRQVEDIKQENKVADLSGEPLLYIYNTHQKEGYNMDYIEDYNVIPDVLLMSHIMQEKFNNLGIPTIVEENDITAYLNTNNMDYSKSYQASRFYLKQVMDTYPSLKLIIDLHRDAVSHEVSTININDKNCARIMFVVGKEYNTYQENLELSNTINDKINNAYPNLSRGVLQKEGVGVNGVYNQDLKNNIILIELGGNKNNIDELTNTIDLIVPLIGEYINEK